MEQNLSKIPKPSLSRTLTKYRGPEAVFWRVGRRMRIFREILKGKTIPQVMEELKIKQPKYLINLLNHPTFKKRLNEALEATIENLETQRLLYLSKIWELMKKNFEDKLSQTSPDVAIREFLKIALSKFDKSAVIAEFSKSAIAVVEKKVKEGEITPDQEEEIKRYFGFAEIEKQIKEHESNQSVDNSQMDPGEGTQNEQETTN